MMTLEEAIKHAEEVAERLENSCKRDWMGEDDKRCAKEHRQLAEWLTELVERRKAEPEWIPISEQMPKKAGNYLVTDHNGDIARYIFLDSESSKEYWMRCVKAWMPLPEPYKAKSEEV